MKSLTDKASSFQGSPRRCSIPGLVLGLIGIAVLACSCQPEELDCDSLSEFYLRAFTNWCYPEEGHSLVVTVWAEPVAVTVHPETGAVIEPVQLQVSVGKGVPPYSYVWKEYNQVDGGPPVQVNAESLNNPHAADPVASPSTTTTYTVWVVDSLGTSGWNAVTVRINIADFNEVASPPVNLEEDAKLQADEAPEGESEFEGPLPVSLVGEASVRSISCLDGGRLMIRLDAADPLADNPASYTASIGPYSYVCSGSPAYPNSLFCVGSASPQGALATIDVKNNGGDLVFSEEASIPVCLAATPEPGGGYDVCKHYPEWPGCP